MEVDELVANGVLGLVDAIAKFDPSKGVNLETYARHQSRNHRSCVDYRGNAEQDWRLELHDARGKTRSCRYDAPPCPLYGRAPRSYRNLEGV
ncbi:MAG: sigma factor [Terriglobia bacterium]